MLEFAMTVEISKEYDPQQIMEYFLLTVRESIESIEAKILRDFVLTPTLKTAFSLNDDFEGFTLLLRFDFEQSEPFEQSNHKKSIKTLLKSFSEHPDHSFFQITSSIKLVDSFEGECQKTEEVTRTTTSSTTITTQSTTRHSSS